LGGAEFRLFANMSRAGLKRVVLWQGPSGFYFLCRILNIGRSTDELKIIVTDSDSATGAMYTEGKGRFTSAELVSLQAEVSYHSDGTVLLKMPSYSQRTATEYRNPSGPGVRRVPLRDIRDWEPFARYTVARAVRYTRALDASVVVAETAPTFGGAPFACTFSLGPTSLDEPAAAAGSADLRVRGVAQGLDLLLRFEASSYRGEVVRLPNTGKPIFVCNNVLQIVERRIVASPS